MRTTDSLKMLVGFVLGGVLGCVVMGLYDHMRCASAVRGLILESTRARIVEAANTLTLIENDEVSELVSRKQERLSAEVCALASVVDPTGPTDPEDLRVLRIAAGYSLRFPYSTGDSELDTQVKAILARVNVALPSDSDE